MIRYFLSIRVIVLINLPFADTMFTKTFGSYRTKSTIKISQTPDNGYLAVKSFTNNNLPITTSILIYKMTANSDSSWSKILKSSYQVSSTISQTLGGELQLLKHNNNHFTSYPFLFKMNSTAESLLKYYLSFYSLM